MKPRTLTFSLSLALALGWAGAAEGAGPVGNASRANTNYYQTLYYRGGYSYYDSGPIYRFLFIRNPRYTPYYPYTPEIGKFIDQPFRARQSNVEAELQVRLAKKGYYRGAIDGQIGPETQAAIRAYQAAHRLPVTGVPDYPLLKSLHLL